MGLKVLPSNVYLIKINKPIANMSLDKYVQWASKGPGERFYVNRGSAGGLSISSKNVTVLAQRITYHDEIGEKF